MRPNPLIATLITASLPLCIKSIGGHGPHNHIVLSCAILSGSGVFIRASDYLKLLESKLSKSPKSLLLLD